VNQIFAQKLLRKFGLQSIDVAEDGLEALNRHNENMYDIIFMDCQMPKLDGYITTREIRLRECSGTTHVPIIAMTANAMIGDREKCLTAGMDDYLSKPLRAQHLKTILQHYFTLDSENLSLLHKEVPVTKTGDSAVDMEQLRIFTNGDAAEEKALGALFIEQAQHMIELLQDSTAPDQSEAWKSAAHRFKGSSGNLGAMHLHNLCKQAELHFELGAAPKQEILMEIMAEMERVKRVFHSPV